MSRPRRVRRNPSPAAPSPGGDRRRSRSPTGDTGPRAPCGLAGSPPGSRLATGRVSTNPPRLLLLNGPPGIGKTTIAHRYFAEHALALCLDIDAVRGLLGQWDTAAYEAGLLAREIALAMARTHLSGGHDVVVPQFLARADFADALAAVAAETRAAFAEVVLTDTRANALARFAARGTVEVDPGELADMYDRLAALLATRPHATVVRTRDGEVDAAYAAVLAALDG